jgi:hypothetical protein
MTNTIHLLLESHRREIEAEDARIRAIACIGIGLGILMILVAIVGGA